jgi:hypothetical protein
VNLPLVGYRFSTIINWFKSFSKLNDGERETILNGCGNDINNKEE